MIEVIYKDESQEGQNGEEPFGLPRNIRQIGLAAEDYRIYMEDYVYTFLVRLARTEDSLGEAKTRVAFLQEILNGVLRQLICLSKVLL